MKLYKFRSLVTCCDFDRILSIMDDGFYCCDFFDFNDSNEGVFFIEKGLPNVRLDQKLNYRICSFSAEEALESQQMWGHYASAGMGVAIEIDVAEGNSDFYRVNYDENISEHEGVIRILTNKSGEWCHEREWRYLSMDTNRYFKCEIRKIHFGTPYAHLENYDEIKRKHRKLRSYVKYSESLKRKLDEESILHSMFEFE